MKLTGGLPGVPRVIDKGKREQGGRTEGHDEIMVCATRSEWMRGNIWFGRSGGGLEDY